MSCVVPFWMKCAPSSQQTNFDVLVYVAVSCECNLQDISNDDNQDDLRALVNKEHKT